MSIVRRKPAECAPEEIDAFSGLLRRAFGAGSGDRARRIERAHCLVLLRAGADLIGAAALKAPTHSHRRSVFARAGLAGLAPAHELGWVTVDEGHRGARLSRLLVEAALQAAGGATVFATSHTENTPMHSTLQRYGFSAVGRAYFSPRHGRRLVLFLRAATRSRSED